MTLDELASELSALPRVDGFSWDERAVVAAIRRTMARDRLTYLAEISGDWSDPYLELQVVHCDGTTFDVLHGDGFTKIVGGPINFQYYLDTDDLIAVLLAALAGTLDYVRHRPSPSYGHFAVDRVPRRLGLGHVGRLYHRIQAAAGQKEHSVRITFRDAPCTSPSRPN